MAKERGWWKLIISGTEHDDLTDADFDHIGRMINDGFLEGEICKSEEEQDPYAEYK